MAPANGIRRWQYRVRKALTVLAVVLPLAVPALQAQSGDTQSQPPATAQPAQDIPDAPSTVQPPTPRAEPAPEPPESKPPETKKKPSSPPTTISRSRARIHRLPCPRSRPCRRERPRSARVRRTRLIQEKICTRSSSW